MKTTGRHKTREQQKRFFRRMCLLTLAIFLMWFLLMFVSVKAWLVHPAEQLVSGREYLESIQAEPVSYETSNQPTLQKTSFSFQETEEAQETTVLYPVPLDEDLQLFIIQLCEEHHIEPAVVMAQIDHESRCCADAIGDNGNSFGLMQVQPKWHKERMDKLGCTDLLDPYQNVTVGIDYLVELLDRYDGDIGKALTAYNRGSYQGTITEYAVSILANSESLKGVI